MRDDSRQMCKKNFPSEKNIRRSTPDESIHFATRAVSPRRWTPPYWSDRGAEAIASRSPPAGSESTRPNIAAEARNEKNPPENGYTGRWGNHTPRHHIATERTGTERAAHKERRFLLLLGQSFGAASHTRTATRLMGGGPDPYNRYRLCMSKSAVADSSAGTESVWQLRRREVPGSPRLYRTGSAVVAGGPRHALAAAEHTETGDCHLTDTLCRTALTLSR